MADNRFKRIEEIYHRALERPEAERDAFVAEACGSDVDLRREVERLLSFDRKAGKFMDSPALDVAARALAKAAERGKSMDLIGQTILHYRLTEKVGEGGMGVVYKAHDTHLNRPVAIKVLPHDRVSDPERRRRFVQEARAASALNHPNIVTIHDIDESGGVDFIAMEYVPGKTLSQLIPRRGMKLSDVLKYSVQIADALAAAHGSGIVHRDLKPANVMVTEKGLVKVLDFGLAKLTEPLERDEFGTTETLEPRTEEGTIVGTVAYMSPEQAEGKRVDSRSDIFSFGSVLYEMVTGRRAFEGDSRISTLSAILHQEPRQISAVTPGIPAELERLISRCLRKDPDRRIQHMDDVKLALLELKEDSESGRAQPAHALARRASPLRLAIGPAAIFAIIALVVAGLYWLNKPRPAEEEEAQLMAVPLTSYPGWESNPSFSNDGNSIAFQWCPEGPGANCDIFVKQIGLEPPFQLTTNPAEDLSPAWSPDGKFIAFVRKILPSGSALLIIPQRGGQERVLVESGLPSATDITLPCVAWTPDSKRLVFPWAETSGAGPGLFLLTVSTLEKERLTNGNDSTPAFSPDGRNLVFTRWSGHRSEVYLLHLGADHKPDGAPQGFMATGQPVNGPVAWAPNGSEILFSSGSYSRVSLYRVAASPSAKPRGLPVASEWVMALAVSPQANRLAYVLEEYKTTIWRVDLSGPSQGPGALFRLIRSTRKEWTPAYSPDGKRIAYCSDRSGSLEVWLCDSDGSNAVQLTSLGGGEATGARWSPDGRTIAFAAFVEGSQNIYVISTGGGTPRQLTTGPNDRWPCWSRDGRWVYFRSMRSGNGEIWKIPAAGGDAVQITRNRGDIPQKSPDGAFLYYMKGNPYPEKCSVWRVPSDGGEETRVIDSLQCDGGWQVAELGIYFFGVPDEKGRSELKLHEFATGKTRRILTLDPQFALTGLAVSPDGRTILYGQLDQAGSDLMLVENFR